MFGLPESDIASIKDIIASFPEIENASIFGSRAKGNNRMGSDVDISVVGRRISFSTVLQLSAMLNEETLMPYYFDVVNYSDVSNQELKAHIDRVGVEIYSKDEIGMLNEPGSKYNKPKPAK